MYFKAFVTQSHPEHYFERTVKMGTKTRTRLSVVKYVFLVYKFIIKELELIVIVSEEFAVILTTLHFGSAALN